MRQKTLLPDESETSRLTLRKQLNALLSQKAASVLLVFSLRRLQLAGQQMVQKQ